ncbi:MAG: aldehyde-activating protein [Verrucomicrobia bacterium]|nr:MAG: aldehyde-activating protein [Verrucomicrobiota bacterium]
MKIPFTGGCSCGAIRYECTAEPIMMFKCHCRDCQQVTGGAFAPGLLLPRESFRLTRGELRYHFTTSLARGKHKRGFCPECGSRITGGEFEPGESQVVGILAGTLDDPNWFQPQMDIFVSDAQPWDQMDPALPKFEKYPPQAQEGE